MFDGLMQRFRGDASRDDDGNGVRGSGRRHHSERGRNGRGTKPACHPNERSVGELLEELRRLGLAGRFFVPRDYADALERALGITIHIIEPEDTDADLYKALRRRYDLAAGLTYIPECWLAIIVVPQSFQGITRLMLLFHELSHLAAGHPMPERRVIYEAGGEGDHTKGTERTEETQRSGFYEPPFILSRRESPPPELCELDADLRARTVCRASIYGVRIYDRAEQYLGLTDHRFPWPTVTPSNFGDLFR